MRQMRVPIVWRSSMVTMPIGMRATVLKLSHAAFGLLGTFLKEFVETEKKRGEE